MRAAFFLLLAVALQVSATPSIACRNCNPPFALGNDGRCTECEFADMRANFSKGCVDWTPSASNVAKLTAQQIIALLQLHPKTFQYDRTIEQINCYGHGVFDPATKRCTCDSDNTTTRFFSADSYCQTCAPDYINYPQCNSKGCNELNYCANGDAIPNGAVCDDRELRTVAPCGNSVYVTSEDLCCKYQDSQGLDLFRVRTGAKADGSTCCGVDLCTWSETCESFETLRFIQDLSIQPVGGTYQPYSGQKCFDKTKKKKCEKMRYNVDLAKWYIYDVEAIEKWESCCGADQICGSNQACVEHATNTLFPAQAIMSGIPVNGYGSNDRLGWVRRPLKGQDPDDKKTQVKVGKEDEGKVAFRKRCVTYKIRSGTAVYAGVLPAMLLLVTLIGAGLVISAAGTGSAKVFVPALLVILLSCTLYVTSAWASGLLAALGAFMAIGAQAGSSENKHIFSVIVQFFIFCALCGGMGLGILFSGGSQFFGTASSYNGNGAAADCVNFYGYFNNNANQPWNQEEAYEQLCSRDWLSASLFFSAVLVAFFFLQLVASASLMAGDK